jgi:hypothetical protein
LDEIVLPPSAYSVEGFLDESAPNGLYGLGRQNLKQCCAVEGASADAILMDMAEKLKNGTAVVIQNPTSGVTFSPHAAMFVPEAGRFVPIYEP